jgi:multisubunit Na+/H+ antiporter MnhG subunit
MFDLLNKSFDIYDQYKAASRNTALAVLSYFFTVVVLRAINKQKLDVLFTPEIASISIVFILSAIVYVCMGHSDLIKKNESIKTRVKELRGRYEQVLCEDEVEELFNSESLSTSLNDNSTTKYHLYVIGVLVALLGCVLYFSASNLGLDYFVKLFT